MLTPLLSGVLSSFSHCTGTDFVLHCVSLPSIPAWQLPQEQLQFLCFHPHLGQNRHSVCGDCSPPHSNSVVVYTDTLTDCILLFSHFMEIIPMKLQDRECLFQVFNIEWLPRMAALQSLAEKCLSCEWIHHFVVTHQVWLTAINVLFFWKVFFFSSIE